MFARPDLKDAVTLKKFDGIVNSGRVLERDHRIGEFDFADKLLQKIHITQESQPIFDWSRALIAIEECKNEDGYVGTLELANRLSLIIHELLAMQIGRTDLAA